MFTNYRHFSSPVCHQKAWLPPRGKSYERGYTLQTLIIIAILVLGATIAFTFIYAILDDSTNNIVGGSESYSGEPGPPHNIDIVVGSVNNKSTEELSDDTVDLNIYWESPIYSGEKRFIWSNSTVRLESTNGNNSRECDNSQDNPPYMCTIENFSPDTEEDSYVENYNLVFEVSLGGENSYTYPPINREISIGDSKPLNPEENQILRSLAPADTIEFDIESKVASNLNLPEITITSNPCDDGRNDEEDSTMFTAFWSEVGGPQIVREVVFSDCKKIIPIDSSPQKNTEYAIWIQATDHSGEIKVSESTSWVATYDSGSPVLEAPNPPMDLRVFPVEFQEVNFTWGPPEAKENIEVSDYEYSVYSDYCEALDDTSTPILSSSARGTRIPELLIDADEGALCLEVVAVAVEKTEKKRSAPARINSPVPRQINVNGRNVYSWIEEIYRWGDKATIRWQANYPSDIAYFEIFTYISSSPVVSCPRTSSDTPMVAEPEPFGGTNQFVKTIDLKVGTNYICILVTYLDGSDYIIHTDFPLSGRPKNSFFSILPNSLKLIENGNNLDLSGQIITRNYVFYICFETRLSAGDSFNDEADITIKVENDGTNSYSTDDDNVIVTHDMTNDGIYNFRYESIIDGATAENTYQAKAWVSSNSTCDFVDNRASESKEVTIP